MKLVSQDTKNGTVTLTLASDDFVEIHMALSHLVYTFDEQDAVLMGFPGKEGEKHLNELYEKCSTILTQLNQAAKGNAK